MNVIEHGDWELYQPATLPEGAYPNALYSRRVGDGVDWYQYVTPGTNFQVNTVKMTLLDNTVSTATTDPIALFPGTGTVLEVTDVPLDNLHEEWTRKVYDPVTRTFSDPPPIEPPVETRKLLDRLAALEAALASVKPTKLGG